MNFSKGDIKEIKRQDKLLRSNTKIWGREHGLKGYYTRNPYQRDYARILYSSAFRRLQGKMQILGIETSAFFRNRLTHSLEVAQIAKGIRMQLDKECYGGADTAISDLFLLDAAALAHDIGHPAFGHKGERTLNTAQAEKSVHYY
jgi:dGTPase